MTDRILLTGMRFEGRVGYSDEERETPQPIEVDVALHLDLAPAGIHDDLERSVNYSPVYRLVRHVVESTSFRLLEAIAETIATEILAGHPLVDEVDVIVRKPRVQLGGSLDSSGVEIHRRRHQDRTRPP